VEPKYVVFLTSAVEEDRWAMVALQLADKLNVSINKMTKLLSGRPGPLTKAISKDKADKLANIMGQLDIPVAVVSENLEDALLIPEEKKTVPLTDTKKKPEAIKEVQKKEQTEVKAVVKNNQETVKPKADEVKVDLSVEVDQLFSPINPVEELSDTVEVKTVAVRAKERLNKAANKTPIPEAAAQAEPRKDLRSGLDESNIHHLTPVPDAITTGVAENPDFGSAKPSFKLPLIILAILVLGMVVVLGANYVIPTVRSNTDTVTEEQRQAIEAVEDVQTGLMQSSEQLELAASEGDADAQFELAWLYMNGFNGEQSYAESAKWLTAAAAQGQANAQYYLGLFHYFGHGVSQSNDEAVRWLSAAANQGVGEAQLLLGRFYLEGEVVEADLTEAQRLLYLAEAQGLSEASLLLAGTAGEVLESISDYSSAIFEFAQAGDLAEISALLASGELIDARDPYGQTALMYAVSAGNTDIVQDLIELGADVNALTDEGWTALMFAARDNGDAIPVLLENGADAELENSEGRSAFDIALVNQPDSLLILETAVPPVDSSN